MDERTRFATGLVKWLHISDERVCRNLQRRQRIAVQNKTFGSIWNDKASGRIIYVAFLWFNALK
jgi:hypothetical protein